MAGFLFITTSTDGKMDLPPASLFMFLSTEKGVR